MWHLQHATFMFLRSLCECPKQDTNSAMVSYAEGCMQPAKLVCTERSNVMLLVLIAAFTGAPMGMLLSLLLLAAVGATGSACIIYAVQNLCFLAAISRGSLCCTG